MSATPKEKRKLLRGIGINPYKGKNSLSHNEKSYVARLWRKFGELATEKKGIVKTLSSKTPKTIRAARQSGYATYQNKIIINKEGAKSVSLKKGNLVFKFPHGKTRTSLLSEKKNWQKQIDSLRGLKLKPNQWLSGKFYNHHHWHYSIFKTLSELERYIVNFSPSDPDTNKEDLLEHLTIVEIDASAPDVATGNISLTETKFNRTKKNAKGKVKSRRGGD